MVENSLDILLKEKGCVCDGESGDLKLALTQKNRQIGKGFQ